MQVLIIKITKIIFIALKCLCGKCCCKPFVGLTKALLLPLPVYFGTNKQLSVAVKGEGKG